MVGGTPIQGLEPVSKLHLASKGCVAIRFKVLTSKISELKFKVI
jgi:hypothetical protein